MTSSVRDWRLTRREFVVALSALQGARVAAGEDPSLTVSGVDHVNLRVNDVRRSAEFYTKLFGAVVARAEHMEANPGSPPGELWFVKLGESYLALSSALADQPVGVDHVCLAVNGFDAADVRRKLSGLNEQWPDPSDTTFIWIRDPGGNLIQLVQTPANPAQTIPGAAVGAVPVAPANGLAGEPIFTASRIGHVTIRAANVDECISYYRRLLHPSVGRPRPSEFRFAASSLSVVSDASGEHFAIHVDGLSEAECIRRLTASAIEAKAVPNERAVEFLDPDRIRVQIGPVH